MEFIERGITEKDLNLTRHQFTQFVANEDRPPLSLMDMDFSAYRTNDKIGEIFTQDSSGHFSSPELERIYHLRGLSAPFLSNCISLGLFKLKNEILNEAKNSKKSQF